MEMLFAGVSRETLYLLRIGCMFLLLSTVSRGTGIKNGALQPLLFFF